VKGLADVPVSGAGLPARDSIREIRTFRSPKGVDYTIIRTTEKDAYDDADAGRAAPRAAARPIRKRHRPK
jgi:hypothetical protein